MIRIIGGRRILARGVLMASDGSARAAMFPTASFPPFRNQHVVVRRLEGCRIPRRWLTSSMDPATVVENHTTSPTGASVSTPHSLASVSQQSLFDHTAMAPAYDTAANIIRNVTEMQLTKMLHVFCDSTGFVEHLGQARYIDMSGCSDDMQAVTAAKGMKQYTEALHVPDLTKPPLPFRTRSFQFITCLLPHVAQELTVHIEEISRMLSGSGYALIGLPWEVFESRRVMDLLESMQSEGFVELLMLQRIGLQTPLSTRTEEDNYTLFLFRALT